MILALAVIVGLVAGVAWARIRGQQYQAPDLRLSGLVLIAVLPQLFAFHLKGTAQIIPDQIAAAVLVGSQLLLVIFAWANRHLPGFWLSGLGLLMNLVVISINGGLMPISPETVKKLIPTAELTNDLFGTRLGSSKDVLLHVSDTRLWLLSDRFVLPSWIPYQVAYSLGDVFIAVGIIWLLWQPQKLSKKKA